MKNCQLAHKKNLTFGQRKFLPAYRWVPMQESLPLEAAVGIRVPREDKQRDDLTRKRSVGADEVRNKGRKLGLDPRSPDTPLSSWLPGLCNMVRSDLYSAFPKQCNTKVTRRVR